MAKASYLLVAEGPSELGSGLDERDGFLGKLVPRIFESEKARPTDSIQLKPVLMKSIRKHGGRFAGKVLAAITKAAAENFDGLLVLVDRDGDTGRPAELREGRTRARNRGIPSPCALGCPVEALEAWVLGDAKSLRKILPGSNPPSNPEKLAGKAGASDHPKTVLESMLSDKPAREVFEDAGNSHDIRTLKTTCRSFEDFVQDLCAEF